MAVPVENFPPERPYSRTESDLKFENLEQRIDSKLDKIIGSLENLRTEMRTEIGWIKTVLIGVFLLLIALVVKTFFHIG